ncbi:MAG: hypothetical protein GWN71_12510, partial [Gammaproteobacteria bacterium]|nr:hypothetical protein [Gemmatimonadota bacterium]NIU74369.1 hypothetical protein [Gammaproteobacteria bacterium]
RVVTALERLAASAEQATGEAAGRVVDAADRCRSAVEARVEAAAGYASALGSIFTDAARVDAAALEFGEEVQRLELASVPGSTSFPLRRAGP